MDPNVIGFFSIIAVLGICVLQTRIGNKKGKLTSNLTISHVKHEASGYRCGHCGGSTCRVKENEYKCEYCGRIGYLRCEDAQNKPQVKSKQVKERSIFGLVDVFLSEYEYKPFLCGDNLE